MSEKIKKVLAFFCKICPFCIYARKFPGHKFSIILQKAEKNCPCCKAYYELKESQD